MYPIVQLENVNLVSKNLKL